MYLWATLIKIDDYKRLILEINENSYNTLKNFSFVWTWTDGEKKKYYCKMNLDKYDKNLIEKKFEQLIKKEVTVSAKIEKYEFEEKSGHNLKLQTIALRKKAPTTE